MAHSKCQNRWSYDALLNALDDIRTNRLSFRSAEAKYGVRKSTLNDYITGKSVIGCKPGPSSVLTTEEESKLVQWAFEMAEIGYGQTKRQVSEMVKKFLDKDGRPTPFKDNRPGKDWWYTFVRRNPKLSLRSASLLESYRASACSPEALEKWYVGYEQFLLNNGLGDDASKIWNGDESGFPLCPKSGKVITPKCMKTVYSTEGNQKQQITILVAICANGSVIPPMHIFAGERFNYNPMEGAVDGAYFGKSPTGWIKTELFYGWIANHFAKHVKQRPVVLLIDGHSTHIDIETSKFCKENDIFLYCLPPHSSHITQPLDVGFFGPLKSNWKIAVAKYRQDHIGDPLSKKQFASVFKEAWIDTIKPRTIINAFVATGIIPLINRKSNRSIGLFI